jgi:ketosteroid isomerase-like protein
MYHTIVRQKLEKSFQRINAGDYEYILKQFAPSFEHWFSGDHALAGTRHTLEVTQDWYKRLALMFPDLRFEVKKILVQGWPWNTTAAVEWVDHLTAPDGQAFSNEGVHFLRLRWGRVVELHIYCDTQKLARICQHLEKEGRVEALAAPITN